MIHNFWGIDSALVPSLFQGSGGHPLTSPNEPCSDMSAGGRAKGAKGATTKKTGYNNKREGRGLSLKDE